MTDAQFNKKTLKLHHEQNARLWDDLVPYRATGIAIKLVYRPRYQKNTGVLNTAVTKP